MPTQVETHGADILLQLWLQFRRCGQQAQGFATPVCGDQGHTHPRLALELQADGDKAGGSDI